MRLLDVVNRAPAPAPWREGENIPWHEPGFSQRMLAEHLSQAHDLASRRAATTDRQVHWIHEHVLVARPGRVLDLGCGPGLYCSRLARLGHHCTGIDYSPASVAHAAAEAAREELHCTYVLGDLRTTPFGTGFRLVMLLYGELNVFPPAAARRLLHKAHATLRHGGFLLLEPHTFAAVEAMGRRPRSWSAASRGLFSDRPHVLLQEHFWDEDAAAATTRYFVIDAATGAVTRHAQSLQAYRDEQYAALLTECGFAIVRVYRSLTGDVADGPTAGLFALVASRR